MNRSYRIASCVLVAGLLSVGWGESAHGAASDPVKGVKVSDANSGGSRVVPTDKIPSPNEPYEGSDEVEWDFPAMAVREKGVQITPSDGESATMMPDGSWAVDSFFDIFYEIELEIAGGAPVLFTGTGTAHVMGTAPAGGGDTRTFDTEMLSLNINNPSFMIRESPTLRSTGITQITSTPPFPPYRIDSFFDIFMEMSLDGGQTWVQATSPVPEPSTLAMMGLAAWGLLWARRSRR